MNFKENAAKLKIIHVNTYFQNSSIACRITARLVSLNFLYLCNIFVTSSVLADVGHYLGSGHPRRKAHRAEEVFTKG